MKENEHKNEDRDEEESRIEVHGVFLNEARSVKHSNGDGFKDGLKVFFLKFWFTKSTKKREQPLNWSLRSLSLSLSLSLIQIRSGLSNAGR